MSPTTVLYIAPTIMMVCLIVLAWYGLKWYSIARELNNELHRHSDLIDSIWMFILVRKNYSLDHGCGVCACCVANYDSIKAYEETFAELRKDLATKTWEM